MKVFKLIEYATTAMKFYIFRVYNTIQSNTI